MAAWSPCDGRNHALTITPHVVDIPRPGHSRGAAGHQCPRWAHREIAPLTKAGEVIVGDRDIPFGSFRTVRSIELGEAEVEDLRRTVGADLDVRRLEVPVDDPQIVRCFERLGNLPGNRQRLVDR